MPAISTLIETFKRRINRKEIYSSPQYWNDKAATLVESQVSMWKNSHLNKFYRAETLSLFDDLLPDVENKSMLDIGCGTGSITRHFAERGATLVGLDFSDNALDIAKRENSSPRVHYKLGSIFNIEEEENFDLAVSWGCIAIACKNKEELGTVMHQIYKSLKPGGQVVFMEPIHDNFLHRVLKMGTSEFTDIMKSKGFIIEKELPLYFWPVRLLLSYIEWPNWITSPLYRFGRWIMIQVLGNRGFGDYTAIHARKAKVTNQ